MDIIINRDDPQISRRIMNLQPGLYVTREVVEVESDGQMTIIKRTNVLELMVTESPLIMTTLIPGLFMHVSSSSQVC